MKILMDSLGCDKNLVDAEEMLAALRSAGHTLTDDPEEADVILVNTCCFIEDAKKESIDAIFSALEPAKSGKRRTVIATGCMAQRYAKELKEEIPELGGIYGLKGNESITELIASLGKEEPEPVPDPDSRILHAPERVLTGFGSTYLRIADGCDKHCTYCAIPGIRGSYRSVPEEELLMRARQFAEQGIRELNLVAQETTLYGTDLYGEKRLPQLLKKLCAIDGITWIRLLYCYPEEITPELIEVMASEEKICHYIDMPVQHCSDRILKAMGRKTTGAAIRETIDALKSAMPDIALRTTLIAGFPGETEEEHQELLSFVREGHFARLGAFRYSKEEGTAAARMKGQIPARVKRVRCDALMAAQRDVCAAFAKDLTGRTLTVFTEGYLPEEAVYVGRTYADAPEIDGSVFFTADREILTGGFASVRITGSGDYDLYGEENG